MQNGPVKCSHGNHDSRKRKKRFGNLVSVFDFSNTIAPLEKSVVPYGELCEVIF